MEKLKFIFPFQLSFIDYPDNFSHCLVVNVLGCDNNCMKCHNKQFQDYNYKDAVILNLKKFIKVLKYELEKNNTNKVCIEGGDPLYFENINFIKRLLLATHNEIDYCLYTGYSIDYVKKNNVKGFKFIKCNKYDTKYKQISEKKDNYIKFSSCNQTLYDNKYHLLSLNGIYYF